MIPELGHFSLILSLCLAVLLATVPMVGAQTGNYLWMSMARSLANGMFVLMALAFTCLAYGFLHDDFSVRYVANHSNSLLPTVYKFSAVWGGHEGSMLLWALSLSGWTTAVALFSRNLPLDMVARVLSVMGMIAVGFLLFLLFTSNPFARYLPNFPTEGADLNPLLQDPGLILHPPMLYMGYVGFSVVFAFAIAALISGRLDSAWARWSRPWTNTAWAFLTMGIALGSWWAYYELGWGGWWFWDPVENASFMPWLVGTALIHSLAVTEKRGAFKSWTILLAIFAFSLSLLGTFLVRSGVLTSVHAFANDPARGVFILAFLAVIVGGSLALFALRAPVVKKRVRFQRLSRESFLLANNIVLMVITITVLLGTLYPLLADVLGWGKISVGPPYFNFFFIPLMGLLCLILAAGPLNNWKRTRFDVLRHVLLQPLLLSLLGAAVFPLFYGDSYSFKGAAAVFVGLWVILSSVKGIAYRVRNAQSVLTGLKALTPSYYGMLCAHLGIAITALGVCLSSVYSEQRDLRMEPGDLITLSGYEYHFDGIEMAQGPNYQASRATIRIIKNGQIQAILNPEKRRYHSGGNMMTEAAIDAGLFRDLYVAMGEPLNDGAWAVRIHFKPFVRWIWLGGLLMALGGLLATIDKRYRLRRKVKMPESVAMTKHAVQEIN
ncbi:MAG: heme lyase CcmF/NrfE family subunit [Porticoccus sp.]